MKYLAGIALTVLLCLNLFQPAVYAQVPEKRPGMAYRSWAFDGLKYREVFSPEQSETLYLLANQPAALTGHRTLIYYWPLMKRFLPDWSGMDELLAGKLEISQNGQVIKTIESVPFSLVYPPGNSTSKIEMLLVTGAEAEQQYARYQSIMKNYWEELEQYRRQQAAYEKQLQQAIKETGAGEKNVVIPSAPAAPDLPNFSVRKPEPALVISLPQGHYKLQLRGTDGQIVAGSTREVMVFEHRREGLSYTIIPESRWTQPERSDDVNDTIYLTDAEVAYFQPRLAREYIESYYRRMLDPQDTQGRAERWLWVQMGVVKDGTLELRGANKRLLTVMEKPYLVDQTRGASLGYEILEFNNETMSDKKPTFSAYRLDLGRIEGPTSISFNNAAGQPMNGSQRTVRLVSQAQAWRLFLPAFIPLLPAIGFTWRRWLMRSRI